MQFLRLQRKAKLVTASLTACAVGALVLPGASAAPSQSAAPTGTSVSTVQKTAAASTGALTSWVRGEFGRAGTVGGTFSPDRFFVRGGETYANGVLNATLRRGNGDLVGTVSQRVSIPVKSGNVRPAIASAAAVRRCQILNLVLGPLDLNLLGLEVHLNRVVLNIEAVRGPGNLLGNLLCAVAGLLDGRGLLNELRLSNLLNRILAVLRLG